MSLTRLNAQSFAEKVYDLGEACLVIVSRKTCHVCQEVVPVLEDLAANCRHKLGFYYVDVEEERDLYQSFSLKGVPQILFFKDGEYLGKLTGAVDEEQVQEKIAELFS